LATYKEMGGGGNRKLKTLMFRIVEGMHIRGRLYREWTDDSVCWYKTNSLAQDRTAEGGKSLTRHVMDTNGRALVPPFIWFRIGKKEATVYAVL